MKSAIVQQLSTIVAWRAIALTAVVLMTLMVGAQVAGVTVDITRTIPRTLAVAGVIAVLKLVTDRDVLLPFLGSAAFPVSVLRETHPRENTMTVTVPAASSASHVVYWASDSSSIIAPSPWDAYGTFQNAGVVKVHGGSAVLIVQCPGRYAVRGRVLPRHVHYRMVYPSGVLGAVQTVNVTCL